MKILQINASYKPAYIYGGPTMSVSKLTEELVKAGNDVEVFTTSANGEAELNIEPGIKTVIDGVTVTFFNRITKDPSHFSPSLLISLWKTLRNRGLMKKKDFPSSSNCHSTQGKIVHIHAWWNLVSVGSCAVAILAGYPVILSPRGNLSNYSFRNRKTFLKNIFHTIIGKTLLKGCHFHVTSEKEKQDILDIVKPKSITVIPNFVNLDPVEPLKLSSEINSLKSQITPGVHVFKLIFLSRIEEKKGLDILFEGFRHFELPFHLTIAGSGDPGYISYLKSLAVECKLTDKISWVGHQNNEQKFYLLAANDLLVLPSHDENFANVVIESLSVGTPVLLSKKVGLADYVIEKNLGWVCHHTAADFTAALTIASQDEEKRISIRSVAPKQISSDFDNQYLLKQYLKMYNNIFAYA